MSTSQSAEKAEAQSAAPKRPAAKVPALILTLGGAPGEWHVIEGVGYVHPTIPSPVGGDREPSLKVAKKLDADPGCEVKLVEVSQGEATEGRASRAIARGEGLDAAREIRRAGRNARPDEVDQVITEATTAAAGKGA